MTLTVPRPRPPQTGTPARWPAAPLIAALLLQALPALAAAGPVPPARGAATTPAPQYAQPDPRSKLQVTLPARTALTVYRCFPRWCEVSAGTDAARGWVLRASVSVQGSCQQLVPLGFKDVRRHEGGYRPELDLNGNGRACDEDDLTAEKGRSAAPRLVATSTRS